MMENEAAKKLLLKYQQGNCTESEKALLEQWYLQLNEKEIDIDPERIEKLLEDVFTKLPGYDRRTFKVSRLWPVLSAIAATIVIALGMFTYYFIQKKPAPTSQYARNDIAPGGNHATLTLANGKTISLSNAKTGIVISSNRLIYNDGSTITNTNNNKGTQVIATPKGGQYQIVLPDGTKVWLNAATTLKFPQSFAGADHRKVELTGEAYFEVSKDKAHPFIVSSRYQELKVLGTHFNISAYEDEIDTKSTLLEGSIVINNSTLLKPGEQADNTGSAIRVDQVDTDNAIAWKNGEFMFRKEPLESIMQKIARWYDVEVIYTDKQQRAKLFGGTISRFTHVSEVLNMLELTGQVHFTIEGRRIMVSK